MRYGLSEETIEKLARALSRRPHVEKAVLYGSRAKGCFKPGSDIDLSLYGRELTSRELDEIASEIDELLLPYEVDLTLFAAIDHEALRAHIERVGVIVYQRPAAQEAFIPNRPERADDA